MCTCQKVHGKHRMHCDMGNSDRFSTPIRQAIRLVLCSVMTNLALQEQNKAYHASNQLKTETLKSV